MKRVYILCEGQAEERFVKEILSSRFQSLEIFLVPVILTTKRISSGAKYRGGVSTYSKIARELRTLCLDRDAMVSSMLDYYRLPADTPCMQSRTGNLYSDVKRIEEAIREDVGASNLHVNLMVHEYESLLFSAPECFAAITDEAAVKQLCEIASRFPTPEEINSSVETAPSKRILHAIPTYKKVLDGITVASAIGLDRMIAVCPHFAVWIEWIRMSGSGDQ